MEKFLPVSHTLKKCIRQLKFTSILGLMGKYAYKVADSVEEVVREGERDGELGREYRRAAKLHSLQRS